MFPNKSKPNDKTERSVKQLTEQNKKNCKRIREETVETEGFEITYSLFERRGEGEFGTVFSVTVSIEKGGVREEKTAFDITRRKNKACGIFELLVRNTVTPCTLCEVLSDIL